ncbi:MAG: serine/threonine protein kinase [Methanomicrobiaceae archaeon]|nr:serine/threonine protein kinase [Methanomicrobiaceae archaeon]
MNIVLGIARGLAHAHANGVIHRDIKPQNILLSDDGTPKLTDRDLGKIPDNGMKETSIPGFSLKYAAAEQIVQNTYGKTDERCDIYQVGIVLYELLTGALANPGYGGCVEVSAAILHDIPAPPSSIRSDLAPCDPIIQKCIEKEPENRYRSFEEVIADLMSLYSSGEDT